MSRWCSTGEVMRCSMKVGAAVILAAILGFVGKVLWTKWEGPGVNQTVLEIEAGEKPLYNPLKGWAASSGNTSMDYPASMAFVLIRWSELETEEGVFRFEELEKEKNMDFWREQGARFIIRLVCDYPGSESHMDIPEWLYEKTGQDGQWYDNSYGKGYSPNYGNPVFRGEHERMLKAVGEHYREDEQVAVVQLGSLGHWGEWHVNHGAGIRPFPSESITNQYVEQYRAAFPGKLLMLRRPYAIGETCQMGLYNDSFGDVESHEEWLSWIEDGYFSGQTKENLAGMPGFWTYGISGGEFASGVDMETYFGSRFSQVYELMQKSHTSFLGPQCPREALSRTAGEHVNQLCRDMGYCFALKTCTVQNLGKNQNFELIIQGENLGVAPFYFDWPVEITMRDEAGAEVFCQRYDPEISSWLPGEWTMEAKLDGTEQLPARVYELTFAIIDPLTDQPGIRMANMVEENLRYSMGSFELK